MSVMAAGRRGARTEAHKKALAAGSLRYLVAKKKRQAALSGGWNEDARQVQVMASPAAYLPVSAEVSDCQYLDDSLDDVLMRAVRERVVYAGNACCHHVPVFQDITIELDAATIRAGRKAKPKAKPPVKKEVTPEPLEPPITVKDGYRVGRSLADVVADMFPT